MDRNQEWFKASYLGCRAATQLLWHSIEPYPNYKRKRGAAQNTCEGDRFQQYFMVYDPSTDRNLLHVHYLSYVHAGYNGKVLRCNNADYRYYILWVQEDKRRVSCIDYVRYYGNYRHRHCNSWWIEMAMEHAYKPPTLDKQILQKRLGLPEDWELDLAGPCIYRDGVPNTARYMGWYDYIITSDWRDEQTVLIDMRQYTDDSWQPSQLYTNEQEKATTRLRLIEEELIARTWHPKRFLDWCIPACEKEELA